MNQFPIPKILQCAHFVSNSTSTDSRTVRDYCFDYYLDGAREIELEGKTYTLSRGSLVFRKPGQRTSGTGNYNMYMMTLDFSHSCPIPPDQYQRDSSTPQQPLLEDTLLDLIPDVFIPFHFDELCSLCKDICKCSYPNPTDRELQDKLITEFLLLVLADACRCHRENDAKITVQKAYVQKACSFMSRHYGENFSVAALAEHLNLNKNYLIRIFRQETGTTPNQYLMQTRLFHARLLLIQTEQPVQQIAADCGFNTASYFIKSFRDKYGMSPLDYRKHFNSVRKER